MFNKMMRFTSRIFCTVLALTVAISSVPMPAFAEDNSNDPFIVVSLGDSYSAGEGIPDFHGPVQSSGESDEAFWNRRLASNDFLAHRSLASWPGQLKFQEIPDTRTIDYYRVPDGETSNADIQWYFVAASGAVTKDLYEQKQDRDYTRTVGSWGNKKTLSGTKYLPKQLDVFGRIDGESVDYVTFTIGGNDLGFAEVIEKAAKKSTYLGSKELSTMLDTRWNNISTYINQLETTYKKVAEKAPNAEIIIAGYPRLFENSGKGWLISEQEAVSINTKVTQFNGKIKELIDSLDETYNLHFVSVEETFAGHEAYSSNAWINKIYISAKDDDLEEDKPSSHSMHPNATGAVKYAECVNSKIEEIERTKRVGTLAGKIVKASDRTTPVTTATVNVVKSNSTTTFQPNSDGSYSRALPVGTYRVKVIADGYIEFNAYANIEENEIEYMETFLLIQGEEGQVGEASGIITNALNGAGIEGVKLDVRNGWNNESEGEILTTITTDASGRYIVNLPIGNYTLCASKDGFASTTINIVVQPNMCTNKDGSMTPIVSGDNFRIVLTWGANPSDLDSHVVGSLSNGNSFHVYYSHKSQYDGEIEVCNLDRDDTTSYGPETITLKCTNDKPYYYYIYRYAGSGTVASSGAQINVYQGDTLVKTFNVPTNLGSGDYWNVFAIVDGQMIIRNTMTSYAETSYASSNISTFSLRAPRVEEHPVYDDSYPVKEETNIDAADPTEDISVPTDAETPDESTYTAEEPTPEEESALQVETRKIYLSLGQIEQDYAWKIVAYDAEYDLTEEAEGIYSVELSVDTETIIIHGENEDHQITSVEISLTDIKDNNCIVALSCKEKTNMFEIVWGIYDPGTEQITLDVEENMISIEENEEETTTTEPTETLESSNTVEPTETLEPSNTVESEGIEETENEEITDGEEVEEPEEPVDTDTVS